MTPDVQFIHNATPLMISSSCGYTDIVEALIQSGANVNKTDEFGASLDYAEQAKQDSTRVLLLQHGGLRGIDLDIRVRTPEEFILKTVDDISFNSLIIILVLQSYYFILKLMCYLLIFSGVN